MPKPHGPAYKIRRRCPVCGYIVNSSKRFTWTQKHQTFMVTFGGRVAGGAGLIVYEEIPDERYDAIMIAAIKRAAKTFGLRVSKVSA